MGKLCKWIMTIFTPRNKDKHRSSVVADNQRKWRIRAEIEQKNHGLAVAAARAAAAEAAVAASQAADAVIRLMAAGNKKGGAANNKEAAAVAIQSVFRSYLARKALRALKGVVKLQAMVRGQLVRREATATLRRIRILSSHEHWTFRTVKQIVETDNGESTTNSNGSNRHLYRRQKEHKLSPHRASRLHREWQKISPPPSAAATTTSRRSSSWQCDDYALAAVPLHNRPRTPLVLLSQDYPQHPNYLADTASSRARARSQSAPRQRPEASEWQSRRMRRPSFDTVSLASAARIQRPSSSMADTAQSCQQWSSVSPKNSECGSAWSVLTNA